MTAISLYARATPGFAARLERARALLLQAAEQHPGTVVQATSLGAEDMVITHLIAEAALPIRVVTLDTGHLHPQTLALLPQITQRYRFTVQRYAPPEQVVLAFVQRHGERAMYDSVAQRKACCAVRKGEPLARALAGQTAWITGLRREHSEARAEVAELGQDDAGRTKFNPLVEWSWADVWHHIATHQVPHNALHDAFFPSIGCAPCTRAISLGEPFRAGRWWWEDESAKECGLHVSAAPHTTVRSAAVSAS